MDEMRHIHQRLTLASVSTASPGRSIIDYHMAAQKYFQQSRRGIKVICQRCDTKPSLCQLASSLACLQTGPSDHIFVIIHIALLKDMLNTFPKYLDVFF